MKFEFKHKDGSSITSVPDMLLYAMQNNKDLALCDSNENPITSNCKLCNKIIEITVVTKEKTSKIVSIYDTVELIEEVASFIGSEKL